MNHLLYMFAYSLLPHSGGWGSETIGAAYALNDPIIVAEGPGGALVEHDSSQSLISVDRANVVVETVKQAEDGNGLIVRFYESQRQRGQVTLSSSFSLKEAWHTNLLEDNETSLPVDGNQVTMSITPYQIVTLRLVPA